MTLIDTLLHEAKTTLLELELSDEYHNPDEKTQERLILELGWLRATVTDMLSQVRKKLIHSLKENDMGRLRANGGDCEGAVGERTSSPGGTCAIFDHGAQVDRRTDAEKNYDRTWGGETMTIYVVTDGEAGDNDIVGLCDSCDMANDIRKRNPGWRVIQIFETNYDETARNSFTEGGGR
mgnify:CR=1 FL=1